MARNQTNYNKPVGIIDGTLYLVNYTFEDTMHDEPFVGVTGSVLSPLTQEYIDYQNDPENVMERYRDHWVEAVRSNSTDESLEDWVTSNVINDYQDGLFPGHDNSDVHYVEDDEEVKKHFPDAVSFECIGGGRSFSKNMQWDVILDQHLVDEINRLEKEDERRSKEAV